MPKTVTKLNIAAARAQMDLLTKHNKPVPPHVATVAGMNEGDRIGAPRAPEASGAGVHRAPDDTGPASAAKKSEAKYRK